MNNRSVTLRCEEMTLIFYSHSCGLKHLWRIHFPADCAGSSVTSFPGSSLTVPLTRLSLLHHCLSFCTSLICSLGSAVSIAVSNVGYTRGILKLQSEPSLSLKQDNFTHVTQRDRLTCKLICSIHTLTPLTVCCWLSTATVYFWQWASCSVRKH